MGSKYLRPRFFIIGERKCGTSSLYRYLCEHPQILPCRVKEPQFFSKSLLKRLLNYRNYLALFPEKNGNSPVEMEWVDLNPDGTYSTRIIQYARNHDLRELTGEASANAMATVPPARMKRYFPDGVFIAILRDPVERAFSHYRMLQRFAAEGRNLPFRPINFETDAMREIADIRAGRRSYFVGPGMYSIYLEEWIRTFPREQVLVVFSADLENRQACVPTLTKIISRLGLEGYDFGGITGEKFNVSIKSEIPASAGEMLRNFYLQYDTQLERLLDMKLPWN